jgi:hypothetical protein
MNKDREISWQGIVVLIIFFIIVSIITSDIELGL